MPPARCRGGRIQLVQKVQAVQIVQGAKTVGDISKRMQKVDCTAHGTQGIGLVCEHVAYAVDRRERVGFFWGDDTDSARPDAWCAECERALVALEGASSEEWFKNAGFKILCAKCWDEAKVICGGFALG